MKLQYTQYDTDKVNKQEIKEDLINQFKNDLDDLIEDVYDEDGNKIGAKIRFYKVKENPAN